MRLSIGITAAFAVGIGGIALWITWQMQQSLIKSLVLNDLGIEVAAMAMQYRSRIITLEAAYEQILIKADRNRLKQVLLNLIDNAVKYSDPHFAIALVLGLTAEGSMIHVCNCCLGIPLTQQHLIDEVRNCFTDSCSLGLSIVKIVVDSMGGSVIVRSKLGESSTFKVTLSSAA